MRAKQCICCQQAETCDLSILRLRPIYTFDAVKKLFYSDFTVTTKKDVSPEIKHRIILANSCYYGLNGQLSNIDLSTSTKLILYKTLILPMLLYGAEAWILLNTDAAALRVFERNVLRKIFDPVRLGHDFHIRYNSELYELHNGMYVVQRSLALPCRSCGGGCFNEAGI